MSSPSKRKYPRGTDTHSRVYTLWRAMLWRCTNPAHAAYARYGGRGIKMCDAWLTFTGFREWALGSGYSDALSVDRIDNDRDYCPDNCRWATAKEQARNRRVPVRAFTAFGETKPMMDWAGDPRCKVSRRTLWKRIDAGHPPEFALQATEYEMRARAQQIVADAKTKEQK